MRLRVVSASAIVLLAACSEGDPGQQPALLYADFAVDFGDVALDGLRIVELPVRSVTGNDAHLRATVSGPFGIEDPGPLLVPADGEVLLRLSFRPEEEAEATGELKLSLEGLDNPPIVVRLRARGVAPSIEVEPSRSDFRDLFGVVPRNATASYVTIAVRNDGVVPTSIPLELDEDGPFYFCKLRRTENRCDFLKRLEFPPLQPGSHAGIRISYWPTTVGVHRGELRLRPCRSCAVTTVDLVGEAALPGVSAEPRRLDLGRALVGESTTRPVDLVGFLDLPFELDLLHVEGPAAGAFSVEPGIAPQEAGRISIPVRFDPGFVGVAEAELVAAVNGGGEVRVPLSGRGTSSDFVVSPGTVDFGLWPADTPGERTISIHVAGDGAPTSFASAHIEGDPAFQAELPAAPFELPATGLHLPVTLQSDVPGTVRGTLVLDPGEPGQFQVRVPLQGTVVPSGFCSLWVSPSDLRFGLRPLGSSMKRTVRLQNAGGAACSFGGLEVLGSTAFSLLGVWPEVRTLASGESVDVEIAYRPRTPGEDLDRGVLRVLQPSRSVPELLVPISGEGAGSLDAFAVEFAPVAIGDAGLAVATLRNAGRAGVRVLGVDLVDGATSSFALAGEVPEEVAPQTSSSIPLTFRPRHTGLRTEEMEIRTDAGREPVIVQLSGEGKPGCIDGCGSLAVTCPDTFAAPAYDWVQLGTAALHSGGEQVECTFRTLNARKPELIKAHGCDADVVLGDAGLYDLELTARTRSGEEQRCKVTVVARARDSLVVRSWPVPASAELDLRLFHPDAGDPSVADSWDEAEVCWSGNSSPSWNEASAAGDPVFHNGRNGMPDVIRIPEAAQQQTLGVGVRWSGGGTQSLSASTEIFCANSTSLLESTMVQRYGAYHQADVEIDDMGRCTITEQQEALYVP